MEPYELRPIPKISPKILPSPISQEMKEPPKLSFHKSCTLFPALTEEEAELLYRKMSVLREISPQVITMKPVKAIAMNIMPQRINSPQRK
jgi:hypothetical protein